MGGPRATSHGRPADGGRHDGDEAGDRVLGEAGTGEHRADGGAGGGTGEGAGADARRRGLEHGRDGEGPAAGAGADRGRAAGLRDAQRRLPEAERVRDAGPGTAGADGGGVDVLTTTHFFAGVDRALRFLRGATTRARSSR